LSCVPDLARRLLSTAAMTKLAAVTVFLLASTSVALAQGAAPVTTTTTTTTTCTGSVCTTSTSAAPAGTAAPTGPSTVAAPDPNQPPHNQDWNNVSNINGQLVKVGESNEYLKSYKKWNVSTNPVGMMLGYYGLSVSYAINDNIAVRADVNYMNPLGNDYVTGVEVGVGVPIYFRRTYQGLFLEPGFVSQTFSATTCPDGGCSASGDSSDTITMFGPQMLVGWHWSWDSGLNFALAAGAGRNWGKSNDWNDPGVFPNGYMRFGYEF
jgi:hypothetical protein